MAFDRASGILLHPTSLPGPHGVGDIGDAAHRFLEFLNDTEQRVWQVLPLGPTGYGDSPYQCFSAFAGNPLLIALNKLKDLALLTEDDLSDAPDFPVHNIDYGWAIDYKGKKLRQAYEHFHGQPDNEFDAFCQDEAHWLNDFADFMAIKQHFGGGSWVNWPKELIQRDDKALQDIREQLADEIRYQKFLQWLFFQQWRDLKTVANERGISIMGDIPIFVAHDSADVWANPDLFYLDDLGNPTVVAGVPPDYFSATGQRWGNPLYRWDLMAERNYTWWIDRFQSLLSMVDIVRIDHFRGFEAYWEIPASEETAMKGQWVKGPGVPFFEAVLKALDSDELPLVAEDLGVITPEVTALRKHFNLPGMRILVFAFSSGPDNEFLPHHYDHNTVVYTGTHDNETTVGWFFRTDTTGTTEDPAQIQGERNFARSYAKILVDHEVHWDLIRLAMGSVADTTLIPMQDVLGLGNEARMNYPSSERGNWQWRYSDDQVSDEIKRRLRELTEIYGRVPAGQDAE
jgi:4-alpha-glucanotransferase